MRRISITLAFSLLDINFLHNRGIEPTERRQKTKPRLPIGVEREELDGSLLNGFEVVLVSAFYDYHVDWSTAYANLRNTGK
jgi:hypothetical protein